jgi:PHD/YefM family antitoxin component YafN of YafNO toxin-antitoxin module
MRRTTNPPSAKQKAAEFLRELREAGQPVTLTISGRAEFVVEDAKSYQKLLELVERLETIGAVREGLASADRGEGRPAEEFFEELGQGRNSRPGA